MSNSNQSSASFPRSTPGTVCATLVLLVITLAKLVAVLFLAGLYPSPLGHPGPQPPPDSRMRSHYAQHKAEFARLAEMLAHERELLLVYPGSGQCETVDRHHVQAGESERCDEYLRLFASLELSWAYVDREPVRLAIYRWGLTGHGLTKGFLYTTEPALLDGMLVENTGTRGNPMPRYSQVDEHWYIYFE